MKGAIPSGPEIVREAIVVVGGALLAAWVIGQIPQLRNWMRAQWQGADGRQG